MMRRIGNDAKSNKHIYQHLPLGSSEINNGVGVERVLVGASRTNNDDQSFMVDDGC